MRKRSYTTMAKLEVKDQDIKRQLDTLKMEHSILKQKYEELQAQRNILKQGNSNLINQFLFDKHRDQLNRLSDALKEKNIQIAQLKKILQHIYKILREPNFSPQADHFLNEKQTFNYQHSSKFTIRITDQNFLQSLWGKKNQFNPQQVKQSITKLKQNLLKESALNKQLQEENVLLGQEIQFLRANLQQISNDLQKSAPEQLLKNNEELIQKVSNMTRQLHSLRMQKIHLSELLKQKEEQSKTKEKQFITQNKELSQKIKQLDRQVKLRKSSLQNNDTKQQNMSSKQARFIDTEINMSVSICNTQEMKKSLIYQKLSESCMQESIVTESYDKKFSRLEKTNASLQKDYKNSQQKIKNINREYSKLKLDYLKLSEQWKLRQDQFEKRIQILNNKLQSANKKFKQHETVVSTIKTEKQREKSTLKSIILDLQSKKIEQQKQIEKHKLQIHNLKEQIEQTKKIHQKINQNSFELQNEKNKNQILEKTLNQYQAIIQDMRKINASQKQESRQKYFSRKDKKSSQKINASSTSLISPYKKLNTSSSDLNIKIQSDTILKSLKNQIKVLEMNLKLQNERYNILQNSNKQLRRQLLKMIDQQQKLRKDLINQKIKTKTKSISSKNSRGFVSRRLKEDFSQQKNQRRLNQCESNLQLPIGNNYKGHNQYTKRNTDRSFDSVELRRGVYASNSNSQIVMNTERPNINEVKQTQSKPQGSYLKAMRQRKFDPHQTSNAVSVKQTCLTERSPPMNKNSQNSTERKNKGKERSPHQLNQKDQVENIQSNDIPKLFSPAAKKTQNEPYKNSTLTNKKIINEMNFSQTKSSSKAQKGNEKDDPKINSQMNQAKSINQTKQYVYQPPKKYIPGLKMVTSITNQTETKERQNNKERIVYDEKEEDLISLSNDNREITLQISSSKSNLSKADIILESIKVQSVYEEMNRWQKSIKEPHSDRKVQSPQSNEQSTKQMKNKILLMGKIQSTKSNAEVRFMRKN